MSKYDPQNDITNLMKLYKQEVKTSPGIPDKTILLLRSKLILEEALEFIKAAGCTVVISDKNNGNTHDRLEVEYNTNPDLVEMADAIGDILVVTYGAACALGLPVTSIWNEINRSNLSKVHPDGTLHKRADGKVMKPISFSPPDIKRILDKHANELAFEWVVSKFPKVKAASIKGQNIWAFMATEACGKEGPFGYQLAEQANNMNDVPPTLKPIKVTIEISKFLGKVQGEMFNISEVAEDFGITSKTLTYILDLYSKVFPGLVYTEQTETTKTATVVPSVGYAQREGPTPMKGW